MALGLGNVSGMALGTSLSRATGVIRDIALVAAIGTGIFSDTYSVANSLPNIIYILIAGGAINAVFIPALVRHMENDEDSGKLFTDRLLTLVAIVLVAIVLVALLGSSLIVHLYATKSWGSADFHVATIFALWCIPQIIFYGIYTLGTQILNARNVFKLPMFAPIVNNLIVIVTALAFLAITNKMPGTDTVTSGQLALLGAGTTIGVVAQALILLPALSKSGYNYQPRFDFRNSGLGKLGDLAIWTVGFVLVNQISLLIIARLTTYANVIAEKNGDIAIGFTSYQKGQLMMMLPHSIITVSIITALLPRLSKHSHAENLGEFGSELSIALRNVITFVVPCAGILIFMGGQIGTILYGHGAATYEQGGAVGIISSMFAIGLPAFSIFYVLLRTYYAQENTKTPFFLNLGFNLLHMGIGLTLFVFLPNHLKVQGLAIAYSLAYVLVCGFTWQKVADRLTQVNSGKLLRLLARVATAVIISGAIASLCAKLLISGQSSISATLQLIIFAVLFASSCLGFAKLMHINELTGLASAIKSRLTNKG